MKSLFPAALLALTVLTVSAAEQRLSFVRPSKTGDFFNAEINLAAQREYKFILPGPGKPVEKQESLTATFFADLKVLEVDRAGSPLRLELRISSAGGFLNGNRFDSALLNRKTVIADLRSPPARFTDKATGQAVAPSAAALLGAVFRPPTGDTLSNTLGSSAPLQIGYKWNISALPVLQSLRKRGLVLSPDSITAQAKIAEKENYRGVETCRVDVDIASSGVSTLDFRLRSSVWVPLDPKRNIVRTLRTGVEVVDTVLPGDNPLAAGSSMRVISKESLEAILLPAQEKKELPKTGFWTDFILR